LQSLRLRLLGKHTGRYDAKAWRKLKNYRHTNPPGGSRAWNMVRKALKDGTLVREPCGVCGDEDSHAHHPKGYDHPLVVAWRCQSCHQREEGNPETLKIIGAAYGQGKKEGTVA